MLWMLILIAAFFVFVLAAVLKSKKTIGDSVGLPYLLEETLFSPAERSFLNVLDHAVGSEHRVFGKVRIADIARIKSGLSNSARQGALNRIASKHFDFVICRANDLKVLCAIELNDKSHSSKRAQARDHLVENICKIIKLPLLQIPAKRAYSSQEIQNLIIELIGSKEIERNADTNQR